MVFVVLVNGASSRNVNRICLLVGKKTCREIPNRSFALLDLLRNSNELKLKFIRITQKVYSLSIHIRGFV